MELTAVTVRLPRDLDAASLARLHGDLDAALAGPAPLVLVVGAAEDTYCLGLAIGACLDEAPPVDGFSDVLRTMHLARKPLVAVVDGRAIGGGMGLACGCDWLIATDRATFALPELLWGLVPAIIWPVVTDRMDPRAARRWTVTAHARNAQDGFEAGLVDELVRPEQLEGAVRRAARALCRLDPDALCQLRQWSRASRQHDLPTALGLGARLTASRLRQPGVRRRWQAFEDGGAPWSS